MTDVQGNEAEEVYTDVLDAAPVTIEDSRGLTEHGIAFTPEIQTIMELSGRHGKDAVSEALTGKVYDGHKSTTAPDAILDLGKKLGQGVSSSTYKDRGGSRGGDSTTYEARDRGAWTAAAAPLVEAHGTIYIGEEDNLTA